jgi:drug/metabolite transporter (DMT)-like permease
MAACFSFLDASAKYLGQQGVAPPFIAWARFAGHVLMVLLLFRAWNNPALYKVQNFPAQIVRGVFLFGSTIFNFLAVQTLQLAETVSIGFFSPMLITALAGPLLGEWAGWRRWLAIFVGFAGVLVVTRSGLGSFEIGHLYALFGMTSYSLYVIMTRHMGAKETSESLIFFSALVPTIFMLPVVPVYGSIPDEPLLWGLMFALGILGGGGHYMLILAYKGTSPSTLAPYSYSQIVWMIGLGWMVFGDLPDRWTLTGASIIIASGLYILHREHRLRLASRSAPNAESEQLAKKL